MYGPYRDHMDRWDGGAVFLMVLMMAVLVAAAVALVVWLVRTTGRHDTSAPTALDSAERVLAERFAKGEIDEEEFTRRRALLRAGAGK